MNTNRIMAIIFAAFIIWWGYLTSNLPESTVPGEPGPRFFPMVILGLMALMTVLLFFQKEKVKKEETVVVKSENDEVQIEIEPEETHPMRSVLFFYGVFLGVIGLVYLLGFLVGMIVGLTIMLTLVGWKIFPRAIIFSSAVTLVIYGVFDMLMNIPLPKGLLF